MYVSSYADPSVIFHSARNLAAISFPARISSFPMWYWGPSSTVTLRVMIPFDPGSVSGMEEESRKPGTVQLHQAVKPASDLGVPLPDTGIPQ